MSKSDTMDIPTETVVGIETSGNRMDSRVEIDLDADKSAPTVTINQAMYDINDPPDVAEQFAMFPDRAEGNDNLVYVLMKTEASKEHLSIVFCADCVAPKYYQHCNGAWQYRYEACAVDKDFYCPNFYAELTRRISTIASGARLWYQLLAKSVYIPQHARGCICSSAPEYVMQGKEGLARSIYFRHCDGGFKNALMQRLGSSLTSDTSRWINQEVVFGAHQVPGFEWKEDTKVQNIVIVENITRL